jgi:Zn-dependent peptidase ImmA (M78 family)
VTDQPARKRRPRWDADFVIPKSVPIPGCRIGVSGVNDSGEPNTVDGAWVYSASQDKARIFIDSSLPLPVQRYTLLHELIHALNDILDQMIEHHPDLVQTRYMAGLTPRPDVTKEVLEPNDKGA